MVKARAVLHDVSDGGLSADHAKRSLPIAVAPTTIDEASNTFRPGLHAIACWRLDDARFGFDASFIEDTAAEELASLASLASAHPDAPLSVFGHADLTGRDEYNKRLSGRRAEAVYALITRSAEMWEALFTEPHGNDVWGTKHVQQMLLKLGFFGGAPPSHAGADVHGAVRAYQSARELVVDGEAGPRTRAKLIPEYMDAICQTADGEPFAVRRERFLARGVDRKGRGDFQGCGEFNPVSVFSRDERRDIDRPENASARDTANAPNRRVLVYLFEPGTVVTPDKWPCPRSSEGGAGCTKRFWSDVKVRREPGLARRTFQKDRDTFACRFYHGIAMRSPCEVLRGNRRVRVKLFDPFGNIMANEPCKFLLEEVEKPSLSDADGLLSARLPNGAAAVLVGDGRFGLLRGNEDAPYEFAKHASPAGGEAIEVTSSPRSVSDHDPWTAIMEALDEIHTRYVGEDADAPGNIDLTV